MATDTPSAVKRSIFATFVVLLCLLLFEAGSFVAVNILVRKGWMAYVPRFTGEQIELYFRERDNALGWAFVSDSMWGPATDTAGRITHAIPRHDPAPDAVPAPCISAYGDSFVYGTEVADSAAFPHYLAELMGCPVRNFGVPGYGSDQSLMLFRAQTGVDSARVVIFQHLTEHVLRNVNRYANLLYPGSPMRFKPRFLLARDSLAYLAAPVRSKADFERVRQNPDSALAPDGLLTRPRAGFPFTVALIRWLATDIKLRARITDVPVEAGYYELHHPAGGFELSVAILTAGIRETAAKGRHGVILLQPTRQGLIFGRERGRWLDGTLYDTLRGRGLPVIHAGPQILAALGSRDPCELFEGCSQTHMNAEGNRIVASIIAKYLRSEGLVQGVVPAGSARSGAPRLR